MYQVYLMEFPYRREHKQVIVVFDEFSQNRYMGSELVNDKSYICWMSAEHVEDMLAQRRAVRLI